jgi:hypothetical protein
MLQGIANISRHIRTRVETAASHALHMALGKSGLAPQTRNSRLDGRAFVETRFVAAAPGRKERKREVISNRSDHQP